MSLHKEISILLTGFFLILSVAAFWLTFTRGTNFMPDFIVDQINKEDEQIVDIIPDQIDNNTNIEAELSSTICVAKGGRIVNTLSDGCSDSEISIGEVVGVRCSCVCCVDSIDVKEESDDVITSFDECAAAGYPIMESYPRQCAVSGGKNFVEEIKSFDEGKNIITRQDCQQDDDCELFFVDAIKSDCSYEARCINERCEAVCPVPAIDRLENCIDQCGNGQCQEVTCLGYSCPCPETLESCPADCS